MAKRREEAAGVKKRPRPWEGLSFDELAEKCGWDESSQLMWYRRAMKEGVRREDFAAWVAGEAVGELQACEWDEE